MPYNEYPNLTEDELVELLQSVQRRETTGELNFVTTLGTQMSKTFVNGQPTEVIKRKILYALHLLNPAVYDNPYAGRIRRTHPLYVLP